MLEDKRRNSPVKSKAKGIVNRNMQVVDKVAT